MTFKVFVQGNEAWGELQNSWIALIFFLVPFLGTILYPKVQKFTKHYFIHSKVYCWTMSGLGVVSNRHGKTIKLEAAHNSLQRDRPTPILMIKCDLYENDSWLAATMLFTGVLTNINLNSSIVRKLISVLFCTILGKVKPQFTRTRALC